MDDSGEARKKRPGREEVTKAHLAGETPHRWGKLETARMTGAAFRRCLDCEVINAYDSEEDDDRDDLETTLDPP